MAKTVARPFSVAIVSVLAFIAGVIDIMSGILLLLEPDSDVRASFGGTGGFLSAAIGSISSGSQKSEGAISGRFGMPT